MIIKTSDSKSIRPFTDKLRLPKSDSHKGQNGKVLVIGGSSLFHSASIWAAEIAAHFVDMLHYSSTTENNQILLSIKKKFRNGIVIFQKEIQAYVVEDDAILIGPGMIRGAKNPKSEIRNPKFNEIIKITDEAQYTYQLTKYLLKNYPDKKFVLDAGALQMMDRKWLLDLRTKAIVTPHQLEFEKLFGISISKLSSNEKVKVVQEQARKYNCVIILKAINDFVSDGATTLVVQGGNAGLTKGGTGDILAGMITALYSRNKALESCIIASYILKKTADQLFLKKGYWYNVSDIVDNIPVELNKLTNLK